MNSEPDIERPLRGRFGLGVALTTPFRADGRVDEALLARHAKQLLGRGCSTAVLFGTTGEGASIGLAEQRRVLEACIATDIDCRRALIGCVWATAVDDAVAQARTYLDAEARAVLLPPPYYFKGVGGAGLFRWFAETIEGLGGAARDVVVYDIPQLTSVELGSDVVGRLRQAFPEVVIGVKYSSVDRGHVERLLAIDPGFAVLIGDETLVAETVRKGGAGAVSGLANLIPELLLPLAAAGEDDPRIDDLVAAVVRFPVTPAIKAILADAAGNPQWRRVLPPLAELPDADSARLAASWKAILKRTQ